MTPTIDPMLRFGQVIRLTRRDAHENKYQAWPASHKDPTYQQREAFRNYAEDRFCEQVEKVVAQLKEENKDDPNYRVSAFRYLDHPSMILNNPDALIIDSRNNDLNQFVLDRFNEQQRLMQVAKTYLTNGENWFDAAEMSKDKNPAPTAFSWLKRDYWESLRDLVPTFLRQAEINTLMKYAAKVKGVHLVEPDFGPTPKA